MNTNRSLATLVLLLLVTSFLSVNGTARRPSANQTAHANIAQDNERNIREVLRQSFGSTIELASGFKPNSLTGDFNGDGIKDLLIIVRLRARRSELPKDVIVLNPFGRGAKPEFPSDPNTEPKLAIAILHGSKAGVGNSAFSGKYLLVGESPVLILEDSRATSNTAEDRNDLMELIRKRRTRARGQTRAPAAARGDAILLGTEAADSILYWNGKTYRWQESEGGE